MYKLEKNSPISNISRNVKRFFPETLWAGQSLLVSLTLGTVAIITVHHPSLKTSFQDVVGGIDCIFTTTTISTLAWTVKNFKKEMTRWTELGRQMDKEKAKKRQQEQQTMRQFLTPEQLTMKQFTQHDKVVPIDLFRSDDAASGGRQEEVDFSKVFKLPGR